MGQLSQAVQDELERRGGISGAGPWVYGPDPIGRVAIFDGLQSEDTNVLFISYIEAEGRGAWNLLLDAVRAAVTRDCASRTCLSCSRSR